MTCARLVFCDAERRVPALQRRWHTPDPSPTRSAEGLPGCGPKRIAAALGECEESTPSDQGQEESHNVLFLHHQHHQPRLEMEDDTDDDGTLLDSSRRRRDGRGGEVAAVASAAASLLQHVPCAGILAHQTGGRGGGPLLHRVPSMSSVSSCSIDRFNVARLVFCQPQRGLPALSRGWRTPDPSPSRDAADLPGCGPASPRWKSHGLQLEQQQQASSASQGSASASGPGAGDFPLRSDLLLGPSVLDQEQTRASMYRAHASQQEMVAHAFQHAPSTSATWTASATVAKVFFEGIGTDQAAKVYLTDGDDYHEVHDKVGLAALVSASRNAVDAAAETWFPVQGVATGLLARGQLQEEQPQSQVPPQEEEEEEEVEEAEEEQEKEEAARCEVEEAAVASTELRCVPCSGSEAALVAEGAPMVPSLGSIGHPYTCAEFCKYAKKARGCKDGAACDRCHLCTAKRMESTPPLRRRRRPWRR